MKQSFLFRYTGDNSTIDLNTLLVTQFHYLGVLNEICNKITPNEEVKITISAFHKKSFGIEQVIELVAIGAIAYPNNISDLKIFFEVLKEYLSIKNLLGENKADNIDKVDNHITINFNGGELTVSENAFNIYQNSTIVDEALRKSGEALDDDEELEGIEITEVDNDVPLLKIDRKDFKNLSKKNGYLAQKEEKVETRKDQIVYLKKFDTAPTTSTQFQFIYKERKISRVKILDENFLRKVNEGLRFGNGDALVVNLSILKKKDSVADVFVESGYEIIEVIDIKRRGETGDLFNQ
jgi:hypothetical protein